MKTYQNFLEAEVAAKNQAIKIIHDTNECLASLFIRARKEGNPYTEGEKKEALYIYNQALHSLYRKILQSFIVMGNVRDCVMSRRFMACLPTC